jgi:hypothetical protein
MGGLEIIQKKGLRQDTAHQGAAIKKTDQGH